MDNEKLRKQREYRSRTGNSATNKYERTRNGKLMRIYRNMKSRIDGVQHMKAHLYAGKELLSKEEFYDWATNSEAYDKLYVQWVENNYDRKLAPSVDRIDSTKGYTLDNMEWVTHSENSKRGALSRHGLS